MTEGLAIELAKRKMEELGNGENYLVRLRHFQIAPVSKVELKADNELFILIAPDEQVKVFSKAGVYNILDNKINEMQYLHRGNICIINQSTKTFIQVKFLQVIPKIK
jgi:hypothetical protein